jgi:tetratricopeptide (TPR) repeat protein
MMQELQASPAKESTPVIPMFRRVMRIAAILILVVAGAAIYEYTQLSANSLFDNNYSAYTATAERGADNASPLVTAFKAGEKEKVIELFKALPQPATEDLFYAGNAYLQLGKPIEAIRNFQQLESLNKVNQAHIFEEDTEYYLAMAYLKNGQTKEATALLEKIHQTNGHPYQDKVSNWLLWKLKLVGG